MEEYEGCGFYKYVGEVNALTGQINIDEEGIFEGDIIDIGSRVPNQKIRGEIEQVDGKTKLTFLKFPPNKNLARLVYCLEKDGQEDDFSGKYDGRWYTLPKQMNISIKKGDSLSTLVMEINPETFGGEKAQLILTKK